VLLLPQLLLLLHSTRGPDAVTVLLLSAFVPTRETEAAYGGF
jgi:hypothetical protein